jgi:multidrug resistance efflux pump
VRASGYSVGPRVRGAGTIPVLALLAPLALGLAACGRGGEPQLVEIRQGVLVQHHLLTGEIEAAQAIRLTVPATPAWDVQIRWLVEDGATLGAGDLVAELDPAELLEQVSSGESALGIARDELARRRAAARSERAAAWAEVERARLDLQRATLDAGVPAGVLAERELAERELARQRAVAALEQAQAKAAAAEARVATDVGLQELEVAKGEQLVVVTEQAVGSLRLATPRPGTVLVTDLPWEGRKLQVGDTVYPGTTVATVPDLGSLRVVAQLLDVDDGRLAVGQPARCVLDAYPEAAVRCRVREVATVAQDLARQSLRRGLRVALELETVDAERMRPGMSVRVEVETARLSDVVLVPRAALVFTATGVTVAVAGEQPPRSLVLGACNREMCSVERGLAPGDRVVLPLLVSGEEVS